MSDMQASQPDQPFFPPPDNFAPAPLPVEEFSFTGTGSEYFRIWIVNLLLSILTLGIYSAWAKVRRMRYFYDSTQVAGSSFEYHGNAVAILKGRIIALVLVASYQIAFQFSIVIGFICMAALIAGMPWLLWKSMQFRLYNSSYRGIRFGYRGSAGKAYIQYLAFPMMAAGSLYLLLPLAHKEMKKIQHEESRFGSTHFSFHATTGSFYMAYLIGFAVVWAGLITIGILFGGAFAGLFMAGESAKVAGIGVAIAGIFLAYAWFIMSLPIFLTLIQNLIWNNTKLGEHQFHSNMKWTRVAFIALTNLLGIFLTLGLFIPFAQVRMIKYRMESMSLAPASSLDHFLADEQAEASATGEGMADLLDFDLSL